MCDLPGCLLTAVSSFSDDDITTGGDTGFFLMPCSSFSDDDTNTGGEAGCTKLRFCTNTCYQQSKPPQVTKICTTKEKKNIFKSENKQYNLAVVRPNLDIGLSVGHIGRRGINEKLARNMNKIVFAYISISCLR